MMNVAPAGSLEQLERRRTLIPPIARFLARRQFSSGLLSVATHRLILRSGLLLALLAFSLAAALGQVQQTPIVIGGQVPAGGGRSYPPPTYYFGFAPLNDGEYKSALEAFNRELRGAYRNGQTRWLDS